MAQRRKKKAPRKAGAISVISVLVLALLLLAGNRLQEYGIFDFLPGEENTAPAAGPALVPGSGDMEVWFLDVGQGDSQLIRIPDGDSYYNMLIDSGENQYAQGLTDFLSGLGISRIDTLVCTHPHADHMGSMAQIVTQFDIGSFYMPKLPEDQTPTTRAYENLLDALLEKNVDAAYLHTGLFISMPDGARAEVFSPDQDARWSEINNYSAVIKLSYGETSFLFTGDAEKEIETILAEGNDAIGADVLACGHHGSSTSSTEAFLERVNPAVAVISCGLNNKYGHPHEEVVQLLDTRGCDVYRTDTSGTILIKSDGEEIRAEIDGREIGAKE